MLLALSAGPAPAQTGPNDVSIGGTAAPPASKTCVQVLVGGQTTPGYNCLNQELQQEAVGAGKIQPNMPLGVGSPSNTVGTFNEQGLREQYGRNFGKSVVPYRPPPPVFGNPLH